jgi:phosphatidate cytidylyltransferase
MKTRIISAAVAIVLLAAVVYAGAAAIGLAIFVMAVVGIYEFYNALSKGGFKPIYPIGFLSCLPLIYLAFQQNMGADGNSLMPKVTAVGAYVFLAVLLCLLIFSDGKYKVADISVTILGVVYVVFLFSFVILTRNLNNGYLYIWLIFIGAWATDTFAYFTGVAFGKTKILPKVSPKKSLEGSIGGMAGCMVSMLLFGLYYNHMVTGASGISILHFAVLGLICGVVSQLGDWAASAVKRSVNIKDYGNIMPGHGGVLDRLDSILFVAPAVYFYITLLT